MRAYELTLIVSPDLSSEEQKKQLEKIKKIIGDLGGKSEEEREWGKRELAYPIKKKNVGYYFLWRITLPAEKSSEFDRRIKLEEGILRYLLVKLEEKEGGKNGAKITK